MRFICNNNTKIILSKDDGFEIGDRVLIFDENELFITEMTHETVVDNVIGKVEEMEHYIQ